MTTVIAFFIGALVGAAITIIAVVSTYGVDADDYYEGSNHET